MSKRPASVIPALTLLLLTATLAPPVRGDVLVSEDSTIYGKIVKMTRESVSIERGCDRNNVRTVARAQVQAVVLDGVCQPHTFKMPTAGLSPCAQEKVPIYKVYFKGQAAATYATDVLIGDNGEAHFMLADNSSLHGPLDRVSMIVNDFVCPSLLSTTQAPPAGFCHDSPHWAVNWRPEPVHKNTIFTRGFAFYHERVGDGKSGLTAAEIERAFGAALTHWTSLLLKHRNNLDPTLAAYVDSILGRSKSMTMLVPPQVVNVDCPGNASMIVRSYGARGGEFPDREYVAKAQMRGRTILLNEVDYKFTYDLTMRELIRGDSVNLVAVFAHELGHAFGLGHVSGVPSVMSANNPTSVPTDEDFGRFMAVLRQSIVGARPGEFDPTSCAGLSLKPARPKAKKRRPM